MDRLLDSGFSNIYGKWKMADCPMLKITLACRRKIERKKGDGAAKMEGLEDEEMKMNRRRMKASAFFHFSCPSFCLEFMSVIFSL